MINKKGRPALAREHGTPRGFRQHHKQNETPCQPCKDAFAAEARTKRGYNKRTVTNMSKNQYARQYTRQRRQHQKNIVNQWKLEQKQCADCGLQITEKTLPAVDCDHIDPNTKSFSISESCGSVNEHALTNELAKCQARCRNCHAIRTMNEGHWYHSTTTQPTETNQMRLFDAG